MAISDTLTVMTAQAADGTASLIGMLPIILMLVVLYFRMIRPQMTCEKDHRTLVAALATGDEVITAGGLLGKVTKVSDNYVTIQISTVGDQPVETLLQRNSVTNVLP